VIFRTRFGGPVYLDDGTKLSGLNRTAFDDAAVGLDYSEADTPLYEFRDISNSMFYLLFSGVMGDNVTHICIIITNKSQIFMAFYLLHILFSNMTLLNVLVGVICTVITEVQDAQTEKRDMKTVKDELLTALDELDTDGNKMISYEEFNKLIERKELHGFFRSVGVDVTHLINMSDFIFWDEDIMAYKEVSYSTFLEHILSMRTSNPCTVLEMVDLQKLISQQNHENAMKFQALRSSIMSIRDLVETKVNATDSGGGQERTPKADMSRSQEKFPKARDKSPGPDRANGGPSPVKKGNWVQGGGRGRNRVVSARSRDDSPPPGHRSASPQPNGIQAFNHPNRID
jgi:hypothetical protein